MLHFYSDKFPMYFRVLAFVGLGGLVCGQQFTVPTPPKSTQHDSIPGIGLGTARMRENTSEVIVKAIENGYRHIDAAYIYGNQKDVGLGIKEGLKRTGLSRTDLWITGKLWINRFVSFPAKLSFYT
jgi:diketogulonate reductase-like aldo/keto reductase